MEFLRSTKMGMSTFLPHSYSSSLMYIPSNFVLQPVFLRGFSGSLHLVLLFFLFITWVGRKIMRMNTPSEGPRRSNNRRTRFSYYNQALFCCLGLSLFNLVLWVLNYFSWYRKGWSDQKIVTLMDFGLRTLAWLAISVYLHTHCKNSGGPRFPILLRVWCGLHFSMSCCFLVVDFLYNKNDQSLPTQLFVSDILSTVMGFFFCLLGFLGEKESEDGLLQEPLLNGTSNGAESNQSSGGEIVAPFSYASLLSILSFSWMSPLICVGYKKELDLNDVPQLAGMDSVKGALPVFRSKLESDIGCKITTFKLVKALILTTQWEILLTASLALIYSLASYVGPYLIDSFVQYLNGNQAFENQGYVLVAAFFFAKLIACLAQRHWFFRLQQAGIRARAVLVAMIYNKGLSISCQSKQAHTSGEIINLMSVDAQRVSDFGWIHDPWLVIVQVVLALLILYKNLGLASIATLVTTGLVMLANVPLGRLQEKFLEKIMTSKDKRMKAASEILRSMRILKLQAWEMKFLSKVTELRNTEMGWVKKFGYTFSLTNFLFWGAPTFVSVVTFGTCMLLGIPLESGKILSALATFTILQQPIYNLPDTISMIAQTKVSLDRIASFLQLDDLPSDVIEKLPRGSSDTAIEVVDGNFSWDVSSPNPTLKDINISVSRGMRVAVCGTVGSGKSSLLSCILGEVPKISGTIKLCGAKAYVAQSPWIQSGKIEENILFGEEMDRERYDQVLEACSLTNDLEILPFGDQTVIGERGINLSGGQKQRIQIARALYQDADIYLFDDPFSAVDAHTGSHLFKECLLGLLGSKTVIYVTHQLEFLPAADLILVMKDGTITQAGKYNDIVNSGTDFMELVGAHKKALSALDSTVAGSVSENSTIDGENGSTCGVQKSVKKEETAADDQNGTDDIVGEKGQLVQEEEREKGRVGLSVYRKYITTAYRGALVPFILLSQVLFQLLQIGSNCWMALATPVSKEVKPPVEGSTLIIVYVALVIGSSFCILSRALFLITAGFKTATILFNKMHLCIFRAPMSFFDSTPSGRILNRASTDQIAVDFPIPYTVGGFAFSMIQLLGTVAIMSQVAWQVFIVFIPVIATCIWLQQYYIPSARELARLGGVCKALVIQHFAETMSGSTTIRSFDQESRFKELSMKLIDGHSRPNFYTAGAMEWLSFHLDILSSVTFAFFLVFLISIPMGTINPSIAGLAVTYGLSLNMLQASVIRNLCNMENQIISVERILQYTAIPSEPPLVIEEKRPDGHWPARGEVVIQDLQVRYAPHMPLVLRGLTCTFRGGMKTGIVGRTGSGKSTLIQTLFRIVEPAAGQIQIDDISISSIGLHDLRSRLSIIPQDPTMFEGTVRSNLDPLEEYTDELIWEALDKCQLGDEVRKKEGKLDSAVTENGENWSMGQRQLVCLGRVLLKTSKVLVLDEATASVDTATDNLIQLTLRQHFSDCTVLTIAHRITTVVDSDMVLLLDHGLIEEHDSPTKLLENKSSSFSKLVAEYSTRSSSSRE
ncbi:ABC transporter C family member 3-like [Rhododendron vialii]|uniref:ABC transporter C family member 3-like n=1 Tax=Rhododendron vialii TaxID=182163 RepID=UPI00265F16CE|nr:ABC transporter C family member 3-like [Rhododendron vialii]